MPERAQPPDQRRLAATVGELEQVLLAQPEQRAPEDRCERQVVLGQQQRVAQRHQVHDRDLVGQHQAVGAGDRDLQVLQLADQQLLQDAAARQEDHDVAGPDRLPGRGERHAIEPPFEDLPRDRPGEAGLAAQAALEPVGQLPVLGLGGGLALDERPDLDQAWCARPEALVRGPVLAADHAVAGVRVGEHRIDEVQDRLGRAERAAERLRPPGLAAGAGARLQDLAEGAVGRDVGALHAHDRLLLVADHEQGAPDRPRSFAGEELGAQRQDDRPLLGARVLALVDQQVIDLLVELVVHPGRDPGLLQQPPAGGDQVVEIEGCELALAPVVGVQDRGPDPKQRRGALGDRRRLLQLDPGQQPRLLGDQGHFRSGRRGGAGLGDDRAELPALQALGQKDRPVLFPGPLPLVDPGGHPIPDDLAALCLFAGPGGETAGGVQECPPVDLGVDAGGPPDLAGVGTRDQAEGLVDPGNQRLEALIGDQRTEPQPVLAKRRQAVCEGGLAEQHGQATEGALDPGAGAGQHLRLRLAQKVGGAARIEHIEMRHDPRLERKALEQRLAKAVDGHDREAGRQVQDRRQQGPRAGAFVGARGPPGELPELRFELGLGQDGEPGQILLDPLDHLGRGRLGEGEAEDLARVGAGEQKAHHPVGQHPGLAGAGRGGDPDRGGGLGRAPLLGRGRRPGRGCRPQLVHSPRRAR